MGERNEFAIESSDFDFPVVNFHLTVCGKIKCSFRSFLADMVV